MNTKFTDTLKALLPEIFYRVIDQQYSCTSGDTRGLDELVEAMGIKTPPSIDQNSRTVGNTEYLILNLKLPNTPYLFRGAYEANNLFKEFCPTKNFRFRYDTVGGKQRKEKEIAKFQQSFNAFLGKWVRLVFCELMRMHSSAIFKLSPGPTETFRNTLYGPRRIDYWGNKLGTPVTPSAIYEVEQENKEAQNWLNHHKPKILSVSLEDILKSEYPSVNSACRPDYLPKFAKIEINRWTPKGVSTILQDDQEIISHCKRLTEQLYHHFNSRP